MIAERSKISEWYRRDDNAIPSEYILQPRKDEYESYALWEEKERELREILRKAVDRSTLDDKEREKYFLSATHREITRSTGHSRRKDSPSRTRGCLFQERRERREASKTEEELKDRLSKERTREYEKSRRVKKTKMSSASSYTKDLKRLSQFPAEGCTGDR